jgi:autophagy-related protein 9
VGPLADACTRQFGAPATAADARLMSKEGKMEKSFLNFSAAHPDWTPDDATGSLYLSRMAERRRAPDVHRERGYEAALAQSQAAARRRRPAPAASTRFAGPEDPMLASALGPGLARTVILPGEAAPAPVPVPAPAPPPALPGAIAEADRTPDEGIGSALGESYADGGDEPAPAPGVAEDEDGLADGGVLGLLAQIYGTRARGQGPARVIQ